jgi:alanyl-tRNA synthetase
MTSDEIRERYLAFFEQQGHQRLASASLVPAEHDPSVLLTTAGMHPLKPYFQGREQPPSHRLTSCQKVFRTPDIDNVGVTTRHLTFFEMLGNFSIGDYFKQGAVEFAWRFSLEELGFEPEKVWITVFEGDEALGIGPDEEAIAAWESVGVPRERIVLCSREDNFWQSGPTGPCGPCSELYYDRGLDWGKADDLPAGDNERFLEYWNLVFMQYDQVKPGVLEPLPRQSIDTGLGLNRMALIQQGKATVFETDQFQPLIELGERLSGKTYGSDEAVDRALRILCDHTRGMSFLIADGVVPSNEDRGYVLRKVMRRAIHQGRRIGIDGPFLGAYAAVVRETMGRAYPELHEQQEAIEMWLTREEEAFGRTIDQGQKLLDDMIARARDAGDEGIGADNAFLLHDTYGFPFDLTVELAAEHGLGVDAQGFEELMAGQREKSRATAGRGATDDLRAGARSWAAAEPASSFVGYGELHADTEVLAVETVAGQLVVKLAESPFYAEGGGQVADVGVVEREDGRGRARVAGVLRIGGDQALVLDPVEGELDAGSRVHAQVDRETRRATACNHTATHLLHAALREVLGGHVRQAGSYVGPDKLRFDFTHGAPLTPEELERVSDLVNAAILRDDPVRAIETTLTEAKALGATALFGEKYGDVVRMVTVGDGEWSRELCGGTHVRSTATIGLLKVTTETSSAANVRRIEAITGPEAVAYFRRQDQLLTATAAALRSTPDAAAEAAGAAVAKRRELEKALREGASSAPAVSTDGATDIDGVRVLIAQTEAPDPKALPDLADKLRGQLGETSVVVLGVAGDGRVSLIASATPAAVQRGVKAGAIVKVAAGIVGGGGGGRDTMAQAGGRDPEKLPEALDAARAEIQRALAG